MTTIVWKYSNLIIKDPVSLGAMAQEEDSLEYEIEVSHDSNEKISECAFYISPFTGNYTGTDSPIKDYERVLWLANNYPGFGLSIRQEYSVSGVIDSGSNVRYIDLDRPEPLDVFAGETLELTSGNQSGNTDIITSFDAQRKLFFMENGFATNVTGDNYRIDIDKELFFKTGQGASTDSAIPLIFGGGVIDRAEATNLYLKMRIPKFAQSAGSFLFDLNMKFTSLEQE
jgi:hypothetical protein